MARRKLAVVLGGGAARGLAHIGVLQVLEEIRLRPGLVVGTSIGALVGAMYAHHGSAGDVLAHVRRYLDSPSYDSRTYHRFMRIEPGAADGLLAQLRQFILKGMAIGKTLVSRSLVSEDEYARAIAELLPDVRIEELRIPFACMAGDLHTGEAVLIAGGPVRRAVMASCAVPGLYSPVADGERLLIDGGWVDKTPVSGAWALGADLALAVRVSREPPPTVDWQHGLDIILRADGIATHRLEDLQSATADLCLNPDLEGIHWLAFQSLDDTVERGVRCARAAMPEIERLRRETGWFRSLVGRSPARRRAPLLLPPRIITIGEASAN
ncbi:MAG TPA: patatin-like phospholipase family protein [Acidobacteriota bacterium]|nr:patatin-like phospholipase family protein [Acidobacteriota bacterium]HQO26592.1 patatin-like phospholipase family protein [Acidobacteriota bacterium]HQP73612.1 patatin-like phospholipase family protein [Acidobacteriota bacterium]